MNPDISNPKAYAFIPVAAASALGVSQATWPSPHHPSPQLGQEWHIQAATPPHAPLSLINNHGPCWACTPLRTLLRAVLPSSLCQPTQGLREQTKWTHVVSTTSQVELMASMRVPRKERTLLTPLVTCVPSLFA